MVFGVEAEEDAGHNKRERLGVADNRARRPQEAG